MLVSVVRLEGIWRSQYLVLRGVTPRAIVKYAMRVNILLSGRQNVPYALWVLTMVAQRHPIMLDCHLALSVQRESTAMMRMGRWNVYPARKENIYLMMPLIVNIMMTRKIALLVHQEHIPSRLHLLYVQYARKGNTCILRLRT